MRNIYRLFEVRKFYCSFFLTIKQPFGKKYYPLTKQNRSFLKYAYTLAEISGSNGLSLLRPLSNPEPDETIISYYNLLLFIQRNCSFANNGPGWKGLQDR